MNYKIVNMSMERKNGPKTPFLPHMTTIAVTVWPTTETNPPFGGVLNMLPKRSMNSAHVYLVTTAFTHSQGKVVFKPSAAKERQNCG